MSKISRVTREDIREKRSDPDLFNAAVNDDLYEMEAALQRGQLICDQRDSDGMTCVHVAAVAGSAKFIRRAVGEAPDVVWVRDFSHLRPWDHSAARRDKESMGYLRSAMFPELDNKWAP